MFQIEGGERCEIVILGSFQTLHSGHLALIKRGRELRERLGGRLAITYLYPGFNKYTLTQPEVMLPLLHHLGVDRVITVRTDTPFMAITSEEFIRWLRGLGARVIICGQDLRFGAEAEGGVEELVREFGVDSTHILELKGVGGRELSTSLIASLIEVDRGLFKEIFPLSTLVYLSSLRGGQAYIEGERLVVAEGCYLGRISGEIETLLGGGGMRVVVAYLQDPLGAWLRVYSLVGEARVALGGLERGSTYLIFDSKL